MVFIQLPSSKKVLVVGQEEVALEVPEVLAEAEEEVVVLEVIKKKIQGLV